MTSGLSAVLGQANEISNSIQNLLDQILPGVVQVRSGERGIGTGVVWSADGMVITNHHVVAGERRHQIKVQLGDGREFAAKVTDLNPQLDLARLEIPASGLAALAVGDSSRLRVGELVLAVGHPWGMPNVVTAGIVSGLGETNLPGAGRRQTAHYIRSDVRLAPGNSGGPLVDARGELIGINSMVFGGDLGVSIPSQVVLDWLATLKGTEPGYVGMGVQVTQLEVLLPGANRPTKVAGLQVMNLASTGPALKAGLQVGDIILEAGGERMSNTASLTGLLALIRPGTGLGMQVLRSENILRVTVEVSRQPLERAA